MGSSKTSALIAALLALIIASVLTSSSKFLDPKSGLPYLSRVMAERLADSAVCTRALTQNEQIFDFDAAQKSDARSGMPVTIDLTPEKLGVIAAGQKPEGFSKSLERVSLIHSLFVGVSPERKEKMFSAILTIRMQEEKTPFWKAAQWERMVYSLILLVNSDTKKILGCAGLSLQAVLRCGYQGLVYLPPGFHAPYFPESYGVPDADGCFSPNALFAPRGA